MIRLMVVCQAFRLDFMFERWRLLACRYPDVDVTLIGPKKWSDNSFGSPDSTAAPAVEEDRFRVIPVEMLDRKWTLGDWDAPEVSALVKRLRPDFIYLIGVETSDILFRVALGRRRHVPHAKLCGFTVRSLDLPYRAVTLKDGWKYVCAKLSFNARWRAACAIYDAYFTHNDIGLDILCGQGGYKKPIYMQTQVGVDARVYRPDETARRENRSRLGLKDEFVFGTLGRIDCRKGLLETLQALPVDNCKYVMIGDGPDLERVRGEIRDRGLEQQVILAGFVPRNEPVAGYLNALDAVVHVPLLLPDHMDNFPVAVCQAMAVGLPVIGSEGSGVPYQLGGKGVIVPCGDVRALRAAMERLASDRSAARAMGGALRERVLRSFDISHLTDCFNSTMRDVLAGRYDPRHMDQQDFVF